MQTINDVLYYFKKLDFNDKMNNDDFESFRCVKRILVREFKGYNIPELIDVFNIVDILLTTLTVGKLQDILIKTDTLRENILNLISFKHFVNKNGEKCD